MQDCRAAEAGENGRSVDLQGWFRCTEDLICKLTERVAVRGKRGQAVDNGNASARFEALTRRHSLSLAPASFECTRIVLSYMLLLYERR